MAREYTISAHCHPCIYQCGQYDQRKLKIFFCEPEQGVSGETGLILLISGFGANSNSKVYRKMRSEFADKYNLVTIQCDYFGNEFMQDNIYPIKFINNFKDITRDEMLQIYSSQDGTINMQNLLSICEKYSINLEGYVQLTENLANFNDMGIMQALDNISALMIVRAILEDNNSSYNSNKVILYGYSHGAYLSYLCNALAPDLFKYLIDNSSWLFPAYLKVMRFITQQFNNITITIYFNYLAKTNRIYDEELLNLASLYKNFSNKCTIICYHGNTDNLISHKDKKLFSESVNNFIYNEISSSCIDGKIFKSTNHGLGADFLDLFEYTMNKYITRINLSESCKSRLTNMPAVSLKTQKHNYVVDYSKNVPILSLS